MALVGFLYEPVSLDENEVYFIEEQDIPNTLEKWRKSQGVTEWRRCGNYDAMHTNLEYLSCGKVEAFGYFSSSDMRYDDRNVVTERVSETVLQLYLVSTPVKILEHVIEFRDRPGRTPFYIEHLSIQNTFLYRTPFYIEHLSISNDLSQLSLSVA